jgi:hypothetical protein
MLSAHFFAQHRVDDVGKSQARGACPAIPENPHMAMW